MIKIDGIFDMDELASNIAEKYVKEQTHPDFPELRILNYTDACMWDGVWNDVTTKARGVIYNAETGEVLARPFPKFFNSDQEQAPKWSLLTPVQVMDKMDGSLGILYVDPTGESAIATRGSFASDQAIWATNLYREKYAGRWSPDDQYTYLFEIIYPENRIVIDYEDMEDIVLLGAVSKETGRSVQVLCAAEMTDWPGPVVDVLWTEEDESSSFMHVLALPDLENREGYVVWNPATDERVKIKFDEYKRLHKLLTGISERKIWEILASGEENLSVFEAAPDEFHDWIREVVQNLKNKYFWIELEALYLWRKIQIALGNPGAYSRKEFAEMVLTAPREYQGMLFSLEDGKSIDEPIWKKIRPEGGATFRRVSTDAD